MTPEALGLDRLGGWADLPFWTEGLGRTLDALGPEAVLPPANEVLAALHATPPEAVRVLILGQDPYPTPGHAHGFAFSAAPQTAPLPRSLSNIYKEMRDDLGACPQTADLRHLAPQGVLLLNAVPTVAPGRAGAHRGKGWEELTRQVLRRLDDRPRALLLWGRDARAAGAAMRHPGHLRLETAHPSPLSARRGFFGSRPFSKVNAWLKDRGEPGIDWAGALPREQT